VWWGALTGTASQFILSYSSSTPSNGNFFSTTDYNEMILHAVAQTPGASYANMTGLTVLLQKFSPVSQDWITLQTLSVGALTGGPAGNGTGTYSWGSPGIYTNFGDLCRVAVYGSGSSPGAGYLHIFATMKG
jgi:hypothetical protein